MNIDPELWPMISRLLDEWLELPAESRAQWFSRIEQEDSQIAAVVREVVEGGESNVLATLPKLTGAELAAIAGGLTEDALVGPYRLVRELGRGGMAAVWLAERADGALKRTIALK